MARKMTSKQLREVFLRNLLPEPHGGEILFVSRNRPPEMANGEGKWSEVSCRSLDEVVKVATRSSREAEVYVALASFAPGKGKRGADSRAKSAVLGKVCVSLDVDVKDLPGATDEERQEQAEELVRAVPAEAIIVRSGGGFHLHLRLPKGCELADYASAGEGAAALEVVMRALRLWAEAKAEALFGKPVTLDHAHGVERVWRLAPSWNMKHPTTKRTLMASNDDWRPVQLVAYPESGVLKPCDLRFLEPFMVMAQREEEQHNAPKKGKAKGAGGAVLPSIADPRVGKPFDVSTLPFDLQATWPMPDGDQSENDFRMVCTMIEEGEGDPAVLAKAVRARRLAIGDTKKADRADYLARTVRGALHSTGGPPAQVAPDPTTPPPSKAGKATETPRDPNAEDSGSQPYSFTPALPPEHLISKHIGWCAQRTDAAWEYHEAAALSMLSVCTPGLKIRVSVSPGGLGTNLYILLIGPSTTARKSTAMSMARDSVLGCDTLQMLNGPDRTTPEAFIELMAARNGAPVLWASDEFVGVIRDIHKGSYMSALKELLLTFYEGRSYVYKRRSKNIGKGEVRLDEEHIENPHLCVLGGATPSLLHQLAGDDIEGGLMIRFALVYPEGQPSRIPLYQTAPDADRPILELQDQLARIYEWCRDDDPDVTFDDEAMRVVDEFDRELDAAARRDGDSKPTLLKARLAIMVFKVAALVAVGYPGATFEEGPDKTRKPVSTLRVLKHHAEAAVQIVGRWKASAERFTDDIERDKESEYADRVFMVARQLADKRGMVGRREVATKMRASKMKLDLAEATLMDQGRVEKQMQGRKAVWRLL